MKNNFYEEKALGLLRNLEVNVAEEIKVASFSVLQSIIQKNCD